MDTTTASYDNYGRMPGVVPITIDKCDGCVYWSLEISRPECALCRATPLRTDGRTYNYKMQELHFSTRTDAPAPEPSEDGGGKYVISHGDPRTEPAGEPVKFFAASRTPKNFDRFDDNETALKMWLRETRPKDYADWAIDHWGEWEPEGFEWRVFVAWLFEEKKHD